MRMLTDQHLVEAEMRRCTTHLTLRPPVRRRRKTARRANHELQIFELDSRPLASRIVREQTVSALDEGLDRSHVFFRCCLQCPGFVLFTRISAGRDDQPRVPVVLERRSSLVCCEIDT